MSVPPPGGKGTTSRTGRPGYLSWACAAPAAACASSSTAAMRGIMALGRPQLPGLGPREEGQQLAYVVVLDIERCFGDPVHRQLRVDAAELLDHAAGVDRVGAG